MFTNRQNILVTSGNQGLVATGTKLFNADGSLNINPGQLGIFNARTHIAADESTFANGNEYYIAVGIDADGDGIAETIRKSAGEEISKCGIDVAQVKAPTEECPQIWDFVFDCIECDTDYALKVQMEGVEWMPYFANQHLPTFTFNHYTKCCTECEETTPTVACSAFVDDIISQVAQTANEAANLIDQQYPFTAIALGEYQVEVTLPCRNNRPAAMDTITILGNTIDVCTEITVLADETMNVTAFNTIKDLIETEEPTVTATFYKKCTNGCYSLLLTSADDISTAFEVVFLDEGDSCAAGSITYTQASPQVDTTSPITEDYSCGIRFIGHIFPQECGCFPPKEYKSTRGTKMRIFPVSGFDCKWDTTLVQDLQIAQGQGADLRWLEYKQQTGGVGRVYDSYHMHYGKLGVYGDRVRESVTAACTSYCKYDLIHHTKSNPLAPMGWTHNTHLLTTIAIPSDDTATRSDFEAALNDNANGLLGVGTCKLADVTCASDTAEGVNSKLN